MSKRTMSAEKRRRLRAKLIARDGPNCRYCGLSCTLPKNRPLSPTCMTIDHVVPKFNKGSDHLSNLVISCHACNQERGFLTDPNRRP